MKILLATTPPSPLSFDRSAVTLMEPLNLEYIGAGVQEHHDVRLVDLRIDSEPCLSAVLSSFEPDVIACGAYTSEVSSAKRICREAKRVRPEILTVVGGVHATVRPQDFFEECVDVVVVGEGVFPFKQICERHERRQEFDGIASIYFRSKQSGKMEFTKKGAMPPLDSLPLPARRLTAHVRHKYGNFVITTDALALARSSLGCTFNCNFCAVSGMLDRKMYFHGVERIVTDLRAIGERLVFWTDDELLLNHKHAVTVARELVRGGIKKEHFFFGRVDSIVNRPEIVAEWAKAGLHSVVIGFESHRERDLKRMLKTTGLSRNEECVRICHANNVKVRGNFIVMPDYDEGDFKALGEYANRLGLDVATYCVWTPLPGTALWAEQEKDLTTRDYDYFDLVHPVLPTKLPLRKFYAEYSDLMFNRSYPFVKRLKILRQMPSSMRIKVIVRLARLRKELRESYRNHDRSLW